MGRIAKDTKDLILGKDNSDFEPNDFKAELQKAIKEGLVSKTEGSLLITSRMDVDKLAEAIIKSSEKEITKAADGQVFDTPEEALAHDKKLKEKEEEKRLKEQAKNNSNVVIKKKMPKRKIISSVDLKNELEMQEPIKKEKNK